MIGLIMSAVIGESHLSNRSPSPNRKGFRPFPSALAYLEKYSTLSDHPPHPHEASTPFRPDFYDPRMPSTMDNLTKDARLELALSDLNKQSIPNFSGMARKYAVNRTTLQRRFKGS